MKEALINRLSIGSRVARERERESTTSTSSSGARSGYSRLISSSTRSTSSASSSYILDYYSGEKSSFEVSCLLHLNIKGLAGSENVLNYNATVSLTEYAKCSLSLQVDSRRSSTELPAQVQPSKQLFDNMSPISEISSPSSMVSQDRIFG